MKISNKLRVLIGCIICVSGVLIFSYPDYREWKIQKETDSIERQIGYIRSEAGETEPYTDKSSENLYSGAYLDGPVVGYIEIPSIECRLPLYAGASEENLSKGAAVMENSAYPGSGKGTNCIIAAHRGYMGTAFFRDIDKISEGDEIYIAVPEETFIYRAVSSYIVDASDEEPARAAEDKETLTLVSCHPYMIGGGPDRIIVRCVREEESRGHSQTEALADEQPVIAEHEVTEYTKDISYKSEKRLAEAEDFSRALFPLAAAGVSLAIVLRKKR